MYTHPQHGRASEAQELRKQAGRYLRDLRERRGLTQRQLADAVGVEYYTFVSQIEAGRGRLPPERCAPWADALGVERAAFVKTLMRFYDPITHDLLFGGDGRRTDPPPRTP